MAAKKRKKKRKGGFWNYRIVRTVVDGHPPWLAIHEVYYTPSGKPNMVTEYPVAASGETKKEVRQILKIMLQASRKPVLDMGDIVKCPSK